MLHALLILFAVLLIIGWLVDHPRIALSLALTVAGLIAWSVIDTKREEREAQAKYIRELPQTCALVREIFKWDEENAEGFFPDCKNIGPDGVAERRAAYLRGLPQLCAQLRKDKNGNELSVEWENRDCKNIKS